MSRPLEVSSRRPVPCFRQVVPVKRVETRDPRFGGQSGKFNADSFKKVYGFLEDVKEKERKMIVKEVRRTRNPERKSQLHRLLQKMVSV